MPCGGCNVGFCIILHPIAFFRGSGGRVKLRITKFIRIHQDLSWLINKRLSTPSGPFHGRYPINHATRQVDEFSICLNKVPAGLIV